MSDVVIAMRKADYSNDGYIIPSTGSAECKECKNEVLVSPSSMTQIQLGAFVVCTTCFPEFAKGIKDDTVEFGLAPGGLHEIKDWLEEGHA